MFYNNFPSIDFHSETSDYVKIKVNEFLEDCLKQKQYDVVIVHGNGKGILRKVVHEQLKINKNVESFKLDNFNSGCTIIKLRKR